MKSTARELAAERRDCTTTNVGFSIIGMVPYPHPRDAHLFLVLGHNEKEEKWVVWQHYNTTTQGFGHGSYYGYGEEIRASENEARALAYGKFLKELTKIYSRTFPMVKVDLDIDFESALESA